MSVLVYLIPVALALGGAGLFLFFWAMRNGQFEDLDGAANRILIDDEEEVTPASGEPREIGS
ncbi:cbb3-type cytochrome oxidase assembly protein CcoS [Erythrobacter arachoides]|uniref:Cbb3-type cytochrome oxidase assembly protein CcoS n=1 Tax=Aurantiacibacter arachoides TaxID=1850444 RepID=A0A845A1J4_9SPHN|nr:cbb3-type cytochrome oxidase assembly protein CcoS [Aurantiacibacter arachoides]MXO94413.1 cbb3-type cytochrome oxidase assembly protein CcoS [Aurantiacibacter arachoides]GGD63667.1 cytochrome oxidase maturation protein, cbb3-type [Aurantiacibacter arachoides]